MAPSLAGASNILRLLIAAAVRNPRLAIAALLLALIAMAVTSAWAGYLVIGMIADYLDTGRFLAALILAFVFARLPLVRHGKLRTVGLLPKAARLPVMVTLLALCMGSTFSRGEMVPVAVLGLAAAIVLTFRWIRLTVVNRAMSTFFRPPDPQADRRRSDPTIIDADFRETKD